ncbi:alpha/beta hydrolase [Flagellimonas meridianipacifica]|uniref:Acetyl esterase/lipase n=1 Tax=Flagellimonas meridianipacifica TaxID=1080225 RepID=A0A2T0M8I7_9FLAO|nr:carboxylesterase family protein [Allomuricauda pacifica]PRX53814.1 acetyl esterase/lipase [Allomuricauda pacifica]
MERAYSWITLFIFSCFFSASHGQVRYKDSLFSDISTSTFTYQDTLQLDLYLPKKDTVKQRPLVLLVHGGGFASGKRDNPLEKKFCMDMTSRGYVVASMSYHLTRKGKSFGCDCPSTEKIETFKQASQDVAYAVNFLGEKQDELGLDSKKIILVGSSAGAEAVLNTVFMQNHYDFKDIAFPKERIVGVVSFAGAVLGTGYITKETAIPTLLYHGKMDRLVPYGSAPHHYCNPESQGYLILGGSQAIAKKLSQQDTSYVLMYDPKGNHDWANLAYKRTDEISEFIKEVVLDGVFTQSKIRLD